MKDLVKKVLDANKEAENSVESVESLRLESSNRVAEILNNRREEYIDKARMNIKVIKKIEDSKASIEIDKIRSECDSVLSKINSTYFENRNKWVNQVFNDIISLNNVENEKRVI
jgi:hypothetical protein